MEQDADFIVLFEFVNEGQTDIRVNDVFFSDSLKKCTYEFTSTYIDRKTIEDMFLRERNIRGVNVVDREHGLHPGLHKVSYCELDDEIYSCKDHSEKHMTTVYHVNKRKPLCEFNMHCPRIEDFFHRITHSHRAKMPMCRFHREGQCHDKTSKHRNNYLHPRK